MAGKRRKVREAAADYSGLAHFVSLVYGVYENCNDIDLISKGAVYISLWN